MGGGTTVFVGDGVETALCMLVRDDVAELLGRRVREGDGGGRLFRTLGAWLDDVGVSRPGILPRTTRGTKPFVVLRRGDEEAGKIVLLELGKLFPTALSPCRVETDKWSA